MPAQGRQVKDVFCELNVCALSVCALNVCALTIAGGSGPSTRLCWYAWACQGSSMTNNIAPWGYLALLLYPALAALGFWLAYLVIRKATRSALRQHQEWLDTRDGPPIG